MPSSPEDGEDEAPADERAGAPAPRATKTTKAAKPRQTGAEQARPAAKKSSPSAAKGSAPASKRRAASGSRVAARDTGESGEETVAAKPGPHTSTAERPAKAATRRSTPPPAADEPAASSPPAATSARPRAAKGAAGGAAKQPASGGRTRTTKGGAASASTKGRRSKARASHTKPTPVRTTDSPTTIDAEPAATTPPARPATRLAYELPPDRKKEVKAAQQSLTAEHVPQWDRKGGRKQHRFGRSRIRPGTIRHMRLPLLDVTLGERWEMPVTIIHGKRPGPVITITGGIHGDELTGPLTCSHLTQPSLIGEGRLLDPNQLAGTVRIAPILNPPGYRRHNRYFPDGRDLNREFPGDLAGNTTQRVAHRLWRLLSKDTDVFIDLHAGARGRFNMPQIRGDLGNARTSQLAKAFGVEVILDSRSPKGSLRRTAGDEGIPAILYEGGGANRLNHEAVKVAVYGILNVLRSLNMLAGAPSRPRFRLLASGSTWVRAADGGLMDMFVEPGQFIEEGRSLAMLTDPEQPGRTSVVVSPATGLLICTATHPFVHAGTPIAHLLPVSKHRDLVLSQCDAVGLLEVSGSQLAPPWRDESEISEIAIEGTWSGGDVDAEWQTATTAEAGVKAEDEQE